MKKKIRTEEQDGIKEWMDLWKEGRKKDRKEKGKKWKTGGRKERQDKQEEGKEVEKEWWKGINLRQEGMDKRKDGKKETVK